ncbi:MAG: hypothetical protein ACXWMJ_06140 [Syntrophales bacterium]
MKKFERFVILLVILSSFFLFPGCASLSCGDSTNKSVWASGRHAWFSVWGYRNMTDEDVKLSQSEGWWGCPVDKK